MIQQRRYLRRIVRVMIGQRLRLNKAAGGINRQMQFPPPPARLRTMLRLEPLTRSVDLQPRAVDQYVQRTMGTDGAWMTGNVTARRLTVV